MNLIKYRRLIAFGKSLVCILAIGVGVWLTYMLPTAGFFRQVFTVVCIIMAFGLFGQYLVYFSYFTIKPSTVMLKYDQQNIYYNEQVIPLNNIEKIIHGHVPKRGIPGGVQGFRFQKKDGGLVEIPTYQLFTLKEYSKYYKVLEKIINKYN
ncbi:hypothetical protein [Priestia endophytica]|uniref:hypothetical protein n=1 Tax=Priestia endophytica TaxID=135735 RepID=UPI00227E3A12|nr:hypothetical protein [Priestia endophytica]MCY8234157.1 hypothetical protein [Priestia endophytica]